MAVFIQLYYKIAQPLTCSLTGFVRFYRQCLLEVSVYLYRSPEHSLTAKTGIDLKDRHFQHY